MSWLWKISPALLASSLSITAAAQPLPPEVQSILKAEGCASPKTQTLSNGTLFISCSDSVKSQLRYYAAQRQAGGSFGTYKLIEYAEGSSPRTKVGTKHQVTQTGLTVQHRSSSEFGQVRTQVWNLRAVPPALIRESEGGNRDCRESIDVSGANCETPDLVSPLCTTDYTRVRQVCDRTAWACDADALRPLKVHTVSIPVREGKAGEDPLACAVTVGADKAELLSGQNRHGTTFRVVAEEDSAQKVLRFFMAANDKTPQLAASTDAKADTHDHFELWLASDALRPRCLEPGGRAAYCQERAQTKTLRITLLPTQQQQFAVLAPGASPERLSQLRAQWGAKYLTVELRDELYKWGREGALTMLYSDSENGTKRDNLLATANSQPDHPETWGQLSTQSICKPRSLTPMTMPTPMTAPR